jgi:hypothetical protein
MSKLFKKLIFLVPAFGLFFGSFSLFAQDLELEGKQEDMDMDALRTWLREKRMVSIKEVGGDLSLSGEVRVECQVTSEKKDGVQQRGEHGIKDDKGNILKAFAAFDVEVNLMLDYRTERTWASIKLEFDNDMGQVSGTTNRIALEKAFLGGRIIDGDVFTLDFEAGRRNLNNVFDSKIEFSSIFDGALLRFSKASEEIGSFHNTTAAFLIDDKFDRYGWITEFGLLDIANTGFFLEYSLIDWTMFNWNRPGINWDKPTPCNLSTMRIHYLVSQGIIGYQSTIASWGKLLKVYAAVLGNHLAFGVPITENRKQNMGFYVGAALGRIRQHGDWALEIVYQYVQAQSVPDFDSGGIKRGNAAGVGLYTNKLDGGGGATNNKTAVGSCNFQGVQIELLYAFTNNLTLFQSFQISATLDKNIGPDLRYKQYEMELIYAF